MILPNQEYLKNAKIPVCRPYLAGNELKYVTEAVKSNWISSISPKVKEFEDLFSMWLFGPNGTNEVANGFSVSCCNGTVAIELALHTLRIGKNYGGKDTDEVIIPDFTMIAVPNAVHWAGAILVMCDVSLSDWNIHPDKIEQLITPNTKAIIVVHTYGHPAQMDKIMQIAEEYDLKVIEDCAEAHGAEFNGQKVGTFGDISTFSFYANKIITMGEGGCICTKDKKLAERAFYLKEHTFDKNKHFWHKEVGHNFRLTGLQAAIGIAQLEKINEYIDMRRANAKKYQDRLGSFFENKTTASFLQRIETDEEFINYEPRCYELSKEQPNCKSVYWMFGVIVSYLYKDQIRSKLAQNGIETRGFFIPIHWQKPYKDVPRDAYPVSNYLYETGFYLPSSTDLTDKEIDYVCGHLIKAIEEVDNHEKNRS